MFFKNNSEWQVLTEFTNKKENCPNLIDLNLKIRKTKNLERRGNQIFPPKSQIIFYLKRIRSIRFGRIFFLEKCSEKNAFSSFFN